MNTLTKVSICLALWCAAAVLQGAGLEVQLPANFREGAQDGRLLLILAPAEQ